jgi:hypothetical protein
VFTFCGEGGILASCHVIFLYVSNIIFIDFFSKKNFPPGKWVNEPDLCGWDYAGHPCLAIRDMSMGVWKGFVGIDSKHLFYGKSIEELMQLHVVLEIFFSVYGGIASAGTLPNKYQEYSKNWWWIGIETSNGADYMPLLKLDTSDADMAKMLSHQTYKDIHFIRREVKKLAKEISKVK